MTEHQHPQPDADAMRRALRRAALITAGTGIGFGCFTIAAWFLLGEASRYLEDGADLREVYAAEGVLGAEIASLYLLPFAAISFLWFIVALRGWIRGTQHRRNLLISDVQLVSGTVFIAVFLVGAGALATSVIVAQSAPGALEAETLRVLNGFGNTLVLVMGVRIAAIFVFATASLGLTTGVLPRWFNYVSYAFGLVLMLTPIVEQAFIIAFPIWVVAVAILLLVHLMNLDDDELPGFAARYADVASVPGGGAVDGDA